MTKLLALHGRETSIVLEWTEDAPVWRHWGARIGELGDIPAVADLMMPLSFSPDRIAPLTTAPGFGFGGFGMPIVLAHRDGRDFACAFHDCTMDAGDNVLTLRMRDDVAGIGLEQHMSLDPDTDVLVVSTTVINLGDRPLQIVSLAAAVLPLPASSVTLRAFQGRHNAEFAETREPMPGQTWMRQERRGMTGHAGPPGLFVLGPGAGWHDGEVRAVQLAWSGNHQISVERQIEGGWTLAAGEWLAPGEIRLAPGESLRSPDLLAVFSPHGLNGASAKFHSAIRARATWPAARMRPRPVHLNSWEGLYFDQDEPRLKALADRAAAIGVERFVLDDGWFKGRNDDTAGLGDWTVDRTKYPQGLRPLADHVVALGMEFGLWVEPEMINPESDLYRAHPEWALAFEGQATVTSRHQLVLDMSRPAVRNYLFDAIDALLRDLPIAYLKWDHNRHLATAAGADGRAVYHAQIAGVYDLIDRLRAAHPQVEIEACAGGGGRIDAGMAARTHRFWASDNLDAVSRVAIQRGYLAFMPPEMMGAHVGASPAHATGRSQSLAFRAATAITGHFGVELDPARLEPAVAEDLAGWIGCYKTMRDRLHEGRTWLGGEEDGIVWQAVGSVDALILFVTRLTPPLGRSTPVRLPMLAGAGAMTVRLRAIAPEPHAGEAATFARMRNGGIMMARDWLAHAGLPLPELRAESVAIFELEAA